MESDAAAMNCLVQGLLLDDVRCRIQISPLMLQRINTATFTIVSPRYKSIFVTVCNNNMRAISKSYVISAQTRGRASKLGRPAASRRVRLSWPGGGGKPGYRAGLPLLLRAVPPDQARRASAAPAPRPERGRGLEQPLARRCVPVVPVPRDGAGGPPW